MTKKEKLMMWFGVVFLSLVPINILVFQDIPNLIAKTNKINIGWLAHKGDDPFLDGFLLNGFMIILFTTIPYLISGLVLFFYSLCSWKRVKNPKFVTFLSTVLAMMLIMILVVLIFQIAGTINRARISNT